MLQSIFFDDCSHVIVLANDKDIPLVCRYRDGLAWLLEKADAIMDEVWVWDVGWNV